MVRDVVGLRRAGDQRSRAALAAGGAVRIGDGEIEPAVKNPQVTPARVQQVADVRARHAEHFAGRGGANVADGSASPISVESAVAIRRSTAPVPLMLPDHAVGLAGDQVDRAGRGRTEVRVVGVVAHREIAGRNSTER